VDCHIQALRSSNSIFTVRPLKYSAILRMDLLR
jgi:hypothetical protein